MNSYKCSWPIHSSQGCSLRDLTKQYRPHNRRKLGLPYNRYAIAKLRPKIRPRFVLTSLPNHLKYLRHVHKNISPRLKCPHLDRGTILHHLQHLMGPVLQV